MNPDKKSEEDARLRDALLRAAPQPSPEHDASVLAAARNTARQKRRAKRQRWTVAGLSIAASLVLAVAVIPLLSVPDGGPDTVRSGDLSAALYPRDNGTLAAAPLEFRWSEQTAADRYQVTLYDDTAEVLWEADWTDSTSVAMPTDNSTALVSGQRYFWVVDIDGEGPRRSLGPFWFQVE